MTKHNSQLRRFLEFIRPHVGIFTLTGLLVLVVRAAALPAPMLYRAIVDDALPDGDKDRLLLYIIGLAGILFGGRIVGLGLHIAASKLQQSVLHDVRLSLYAHLQKLDMGFFQKHPTGGLLSRIMSDVTRVQTIISREMFEIAASVIQVVIVGGLLIWLNPRLSFISALVFPVLIVLVVIFQKRLYNIAKVMQERRETLSAKLQENLAGTRLIQAMALEDQRLRVTQLTSEELKKTIVRTEIIGNSVNLLSIMLTDLPLTIFVWGYGGYLVIDGQMTLGSLLAFHQYLMMLYDPVIRIFRFNIQLQMARASVDRLYEILDTQPVIKETVDAKPLLIEKGSIRLENLSLRYTEDEEDAVKNLTLDIKPGEVMGLVGPSGSGKTTVVNGLMRFLNPSTGRILIDGQDISKVAIHSLRKQIGLVAQDVFLFSDTVRANVTLANSEASQADLDSAVQNAQAHSFIQNTPEGYDTVLGELGAGLSGGEKQRISMTRVFLQDPPIFIFDEATSALDAQAETLIQQALEKIVQGRTTIIIAHRFSTLKLCHRIAVLRHGELVEIGTSDELIAQNGLYKALLESQQL